MSVPDILIERYLLGEVTSDERALVEASPDALARVERLRLDNGATLRAFDASAVARQAHARRAARRRALGLRIAAPVAVAAAVVALVVVRAPVPDQTRPRGGEAELLVYRQEGSAEVALSPGDRAEAGDIVQLAIVRGADAYGAVVSIDGAGAVTLHFPLDGDTQLDPGTVAMDRAYRLDDAPAFERFFLVSADAPVDVDRVLDAARTLAKADDARTAPLPLPDALHQRELLLVKP